MNIMIRIRRITIASSTLLILIGSSVVHAAATTSVSTPTKAANATAANQTRINAIITKGDQEINRRLSSLNVLDAKITAATKLTQTDTSTLTSQVNTEITGLQALKTKLDGETTLDGARADATNIYTDYRVYALITPKIWLVKAADDQQTNEAKLTALATKLQTRVTAMQSSGKDVGTMQTLLSDINAKITAATAISSAVETNVIGLQPSDYDSNHSVLTGESAQLRIAHSDTVAALSDAKTIIADL